MFSYALLMVFPVAMVWAAMSDMTTMTIPNRISLLLLVAFVPLWALGGASWAQLSDHLLAGAICFVVCFGLFAARIIGGGDAKLIAAGALWVGYENLLLYVVVICVAGGALALALLALRRLPYKDALPLPVWAQHLLDAKSGMPYGIAIAAGALYVFPATALYASLAAGA